ncbi:MAG: CoA-binding protein [Bacteroidota bacterium]
MHTLVLGATTNPERTAYTAIQRLVKHGHSVSAVGIRQGEVAGVVLQQGQPDIEDVHTVTLYLNPKRQEEYYDYILGLQPQRIIFNPGTENMELLRKAEAQGIQTNMACTLVMLATGEFA